MRCLIIQNRLGLDGRSRCVAEFVRMLNELDIEPRVVCLSCHDPDIGRAFGMRDLRYALMQVRWPPVPSAHNPEIVVTNFIARRIILSSRPDLVFNSNCIWSFLPPGPRYIHYIHFPFKTYLREFPRFGRGIWRSYANFLRLLIPDEPPPPRSQLVANSEFVRAAIAEAYALDAMVIYPPSWNGQTRPCRPHLRRVVTLGSFHPDKRQLEQIEVARHLPDWRFALLGGRASASYARKVQRAASRVTNVDVVVNPTRQRIDEELAGASHFVHSNPSEGFGIAVVEAAAAGCVPVVPNTGGVREIVEPEELRFGTVDGCVNALQRSAAESGCRLLHRVQEGLPRFGDAAFRSALRDLVVGADALSRTAN